MENGPESGSLTNNAVSEPNTADDTMTNLPVIVENALSAKVNGETAVDVVAPTEKTSDSDDDEEEEDDDEKHKRRKQESVAAQEQSSDAVHSNPYFAESIFELTSHYNTSSTSEPGIPKLSLKKVGNRYAKRAKTKVREYPQYLGLQPTVQFRCSKCGSAGFETLQLLNEHLVHCTAEARACSPPPPPNNSTNIKVTRKVFLCSACGTYYENWNLFLHMKEVHKRFICLYCLGMFPSTDKLSAHLIAKHSCAPRNHDTRTAFLDALGGEPCFVMCCDCATIFNEQDDFTRHACVQAAGVQKLQSAMEKLLDDDINLSTKSKLAAPCDNERQKDDGANAIEEIRRVPKVTLKLPKISFVPREDDEEEEDEEMEEEEDILSDNSSACTNDTNDTSTHKEVENEGEQKTEEQMLILNGSVPTTENGDVAAEEEEEPETKEEASVPTAGIDVAINELDLDQPLDKIDILALLQKCLLATVPSCLYCNHARKIHVNAKQVGLHLVAEHRYAAVVKSITAEELIPESFNARILESLDELHLHYVTVDEQPLGGTSDASLFECLQCRFGTHVAKELHNHTRRLHPNTSSLCIMCKTNFYNYSEFLSHLCPGEYSNGQDVPFRCRICINGEDLPSGFRLMVHLRKHHLTCEVCLERCAFPSELSSHVWKHKLHHVCYRCGIPFRNKSDITRHLFWKHGTESVQCKRCQQKKWPHVYHFCSPPPFFTCDECTVRVSKASYLKVHRRLHSLESPYACTEPDCDKRFISKRLREKHEATHRDPLPQQPKEDGGAEQEEEVIVDVLKTDDNATSAAEEKPKPKVDVYDLPELKLSESDSSESEDEWCKSTKSKSLHNADDMQLIIETSQDGILKSPDDVDGDEMKTSVDCEVNEPMQPMAETTVLDIWDNFKNYQANIVRDILSVMPDAVEPETTEPEILTHIQMPITWETALRDHDYVLRTSDVMVEHEDDAVLPIHEQSADHDYCGVKDGVEQATEQQNECTASTTTTTAAASSVVTVAQPAIMKAKDSGAKTSSDSDSSSSACDSHCSCCSSSDGSSSSSSSSNNSSSDSSTVEGRKRQQTRKRKRRMHKREKCVKSEVDADKHEQQLEAKNAKLQPMLPIRESDLETTDSDSDDDFYDLKPQTMAKKVIAEKREKLVKLATMGQYVNGQLEESPSVTPSLPDADDDDAVGKRSSSSYRRKSKKSKSKKKKKKKKKSSSNKRAKLQHIPAAENYSFAPHSFTHLNYNSSMYYYYNAPLDPTNNHIPATGVNNHTAYTPSALASDAAVADNNEQSSTRASKRKRIPNKFYGYSSDEEEKNNAQVKFRKMDMMVPPITIKTMSTMASKQGEMRIANATKRRQPFVSPFKHRTKQKRKKRKKNLALPNPPTIPPLTLSMYHRRGELGSDSESADSADASSSDVDDEEPMRRSSLQPRKPAPNQSALYCYCRCPYDEVSEMIGCDSSDCKIEWFHFECVQIMVPPKGQWYCPDCRKAKQQRREMLGSQIS